MKNASALVAVFLVACGAGGGRGGGDVPRVSIELIARDLLDDDAAFTIVRAHSVHAPETKGLCPSLDEARDGEDLLALVMPPPCEVRFEVGDEAPALLQAAAGVSHEAPRQLSPESPEAAVRFDVLVNDLPVFEHVEVFERRPRPSGFEWRHVAGDGGALELARGDVVTLRTTCLSGGEEVVPASRIDVGFGRVRLLHTREVEVPAATPERPNLILVVQDTQRRDRLTPYGHERDTSPNLAELAARGTVYESAYATSSWTWPSTASLLTGMQPAQHGVLSEAACYVATGLDLLPEVLQRAGYRTAGFSGSRIILPSLNFDQGFERFDSFRGEFKKSGGLVPRALEWIEEHRDQRFFVYLHLVDTHAPHRPRPEDLAALGAKRPDDWSEDLFQDYTQRLGRGEGRADDGSLDPSRVVPDAHRAWLGDLYDASVRSGDFWLGRLARRVRELGLEDTTVIAFTSDHGEELFDHGKLEHGHTLYGELVGVPLVVAGPGFAAGARVATPVSNRHLATTFAHLGGARLDAVADPLDLSRDEVERTLLFSTEHGVWRDGPRRRLYGLRRGDWVLHFAPDLFGGESGERLFRLDRDPRELTDVAAGNPDVVRDLRERIESTIAVLEEQRTHPGRAADAETMRTLGEIGYIED
jgi:arylsulfatase A-like enzyme